MKLELVVVIGTRNRREILEKCLNALIGKINTNHQIIVIDAGSTDGTIEYLQRVKGIHLVCDGRPIGQAKSYNQVFRSLDSQYICWLSDDNVVLPGMLDSAVNILRENDKIGLVALKVKDLTGKHTDKPYLGGLYKTGILNCNQGVIRSDLFRKIEYFDESFKNYGIDPDVTTKVLLSGYRVVYTKAIAIHHFRDHGSEGGAISKAERAKGKGLLKQKYHSKYSYLIDYHLPKKISMLVRRVIWFCIKRIIRHHNKKNLQIETIAGINIRDWKNLTKARYVSIFDLFYNRNNPYYLEQRLSKKTLLSNKNPYKNLIN
jgi:GT2 family glycosyltransferase